MPGFFYETYNDLKFSCFDKFGVKTSVQVVPQRRPCIEVYFLMCLMQKIYTNARFTIRNDYSGLHIVF